MSNLTQVSSGGVERPDVVLEEDLAAIESTANTAKQTADDTAEMLETRVPIGRTINSKPIDRDLVFTPEELGTYSRLIIDQKIAAVAAGGYNPVRVNGKLLDQDITLVPADLGTFTGAEITQLLSGYVPKTLKINGQPLTGDITISTNGGYTKEEVDSKLTGKVNTSVTINGKPLTGNITIAAADIGAVDASSVVLKTFRINNKALTGNGITLTASDISGVVSQQYVDDKVAGFIPYDNAFGIATVPDRLSDGSFASRVDGSGFFEYAAGTEDDGNGGTVPTAVSDRPTGSNSGRVIILSNEPVTDNDGNITTAARQDMLAFPDDLDGLRYKKNGGVWTEVGTTQIASGFKGDVPFADTDGSKKFTAERLAKTIRIVDTDADLTAEQANPVGFSTIFNTWDRIGMTNASGVDETLQWSFNTSTNKIQCLINSSGPTGFVTPARYDKYTLEVQVASTNGDDDGIGIVLASTYKDGVNYVLSATRSVGGWTNIWEITLCKIQASSYTKTILTSLNTPLKWGNGNYGATPAAAGYTANGGIGWSNFPAGVKILAVRDGSTITVQTTDLGESTYIPAANITVDLTTIENGLFVAPAQYGLMAHSQPASTFTTIQLTVDDNRLYDVRNGDIWEYNTGTTTWSKIAGSAFDNIKEGRLYYNPYTLKEFFAETGTRVIPTSLGKNDTVTKNADGLIDKPPVLKNNVPLRVANAAGSVRDAVNMTAGGVLELGSSSSHTTIYSGDDPTVKIGAVESKILTERSVPSGDNLGAMVFAKCSATVAFGANVAGSTLTPAAIGAGGVVTGTGTLTGTWKCLGAITAADQATLFMKTA